MKEGYKKILEEKDGQSIVKEVDLTQEEFYSFVEDFEEKIGDPSFVRQGTDQTTEVGKIFFSGSLLEDDLPEHRKHTRSSCIQFSAARIATIHKEEEVQQEVVTAVKNLLQKHDIDYIPENVLDVEYDGNGWSEDSMYRFPEKPNTWKERFWIYWYR